MAKIAFTSNSAWSMYNYRLGVVKAFLDRGDKVHIIAPDDEFAELLRKEGCTFHHFQMLSKSTNPFSELKMYRDLKKLYKEIDADITFHYTIKPNIWGSKAAAKTDTIPIAITTGLGYVFDNTNLVAAVGKALYKNNLVHAKEVWFLNKEDQKAFLDHNIISPSKAHLIPGEGVNLQKFKPIPKSIPDSDFRFLLLARMLWEKGIGQFVEAARELKKDGVHFQLLGFLDWDAPNAITKKQMDDWENEGIIEYLGVSNTVWEHIANSDCVVLPSYYKEGLPRTLMEANAMERPIITTDNVGCRDVIEDGYNGFICQPKDVASLVSAMKKMINLSAAEREKMGKQGRKLMEEKYDESIIIKEYFNAVKKYLG